MMPIVEERIDPKLLETPISPSLLVPCRVAFPLRELSSETTLEALYKTFIYNFGQVQKCYHNNEDLIDEVTKKEFKTHTEGKLIFPDDSFIRVLELPWLYNKPYISCIPYGTYVVLPDNTGKHRHYKVQNVPNRSHIEFHGATTVEDLQGCLAPCMEISEGRAVNCSEALKKLTEWCSDKNGNKTGWMLTIGKYSPFRDGKW